MNHTARPPAGKIFDITEPRHSGRGSATQAKAPDGETKATSPSLRREARPKVH